MSKEYINSAGVAVSGAAAGLLLGCSAVTGYVALEHNNGMYRALGAADAFESVGDAQQANTNLKYADQQENSRNKWGGIAILGLVGGIALVRAAHRLEASQQTEVSPDAEPVLVEQPLVTDSVE